MFLSFLFYVYTSRTYTPHVVSTTVDCCHTVNWGYNIWMWTSNPILGSWRSSVGVIRNLLVTIIEHQTRQLFIVWCTSPTSVKRRGVHLATVTEWACTAVQTRGRPSCAPAATTFRSPLSTASCIIHIIISTPLSRAWSGKRMKFVRRWRHPSDLHATSTSRYHLTFTTTASSSPKPRTAARLHHRLLLEWWAQETRVERSQRIWIPNYYG